MLSQSKGAFYHGSPIVARKAWLQERQAAGYIVTESQEAERESERERGVLYLAPFLLLILSRTPVHSHPGWSLPPSYIFFYRHAQANLGDSKPSQTADISCSPIPPAPQLSELSPSTWLVLTLNVPPLFPKIQLAGTPGVETVLRSRLSMAQCLSGNKTEIPLPVLRWNKTP